MDQPTITGIRPYPCDRGLGGLGVGYHEFTRSGGVIFCRYCGKTPPAQPIQITN